VHVLGYRIYPPSAFSKDAIVREHLYTSVPSGIASGSYDVRIGFFVIGYGQIFPVGPNKQTDVLGRILLGNVRLNQ